jgi:hypothetical protein
VPELAADGSEHANTLGDDLRSYAIASQYANTRVHAKLVVTIRAAWVDSYRFA